MKKNLLWKTLLILGVLIIFVVGILLGGPDDWGKNWTVLTQQGVKAALQNSIHLGLDLRGGTHLILQVQVNDAVNADSDRAIERLKEDFRKNNVTYAEITKPDAQTNPDRIVIKGLDANSQGDAKRVITDDLPEYDISSSGDSFVLNMKPQILSQMKDRATTQAIETIRNRIDALGVSEPVIEEHGLGQYQILVQLPGVDDPTRVKDIIKSTAMLEIRQSLGGPYASEAAAYQANGGTIPPDATLMKAGSLMLRRTNRSASDGDEYYLISRSSAVTGRDLRDAQMTRDENNRPAIKFSLTGEGGKRFGSFTGSHINDALAVVLDNKVESVANIQEQIRDEGRITGNFSEQEAKDLAMVLRSGALPAGIRYLEERTVGPSLGADSIRAGVRAAVIGLVAVLLFMLVYYKGAGINADLALIFNLIILLGFLGFSGATLTLPGIAGLILTVGMGVDSNVLIFERIREELRAGKTPAMAVEQGFSHAWITIVDTHVTTIVSAVILFVFGTGPVKGFAVTLTFGLLANLFTAVYASRVIFDFNLGRHQRGEALSI